MMCVGMHLGNGMEEGIYPEFGKQYLALSFIQSQDENVPNLSFNFSVFLFSFDSCFPKSLYFISFFWLHEFLKNTPQILWCTSFFFFTLVLVCYLKVTY